MTTERHFRDWVKVRSKEHGKEGTIVWDPVEHIYIVFWDDDDYEGDGDPFEANHAIKNLEEVS